MKTPRPARETKPAPVAERLTGPFTDPARLPDRVAAMRDKILEACDSADIEQLRPAIERNEVMPLFGAPGDRPRSFAEALDFLRARSFDKKGRETLLLLQGALLSPFARVERGQHVTWVWPAHALDWPARAPAPAAPPAGANPAKPTDVKPADAKPADTKPAEAKPADAPRACPAPDSASAVADDAAARWRTIAFADLVRPADAAPRPYRVEIGDDGTWHHFGVG